MRTIKKCGRKGQFTIVGLIMVFLSIVVLGALMPSITQTITDAKACVTGVASTLLDLIPLFLVIGVIMAVVVYASVHREPQY